MHFESAGEKNTQKTIELALKVANEKGINHIVVASCSGNTAKLLKDCGKKVVVVTHVNGFERPGEMEISQDTINELKSYGFKVYTGTHVLSGAERGISRKFGGVYPVEIIAHSLRMLGQGLKVAVEVSIMALDAGLIPYGEDIIAIGGTQSGADTAAIIRPSHAASIFETKIKEIICKPSNF
ncbi:pyruvate kinase alpha/beta domain-containing protein [Caldicellulosiruptoraceae bacterium PP1]